jgi:SAM-dependent methyltransferase
MGNTRERSFFDAYPHEYDILTNATERAKTHRREVQAIIDRFEPEAVLDAGCGTGLTARLFAARSIATLGLDRSKAMVEIARANHWRSTRLLTFKVGHFERLPRTLHRRFDLVVCLANSISGVGTVGNLRRTLKNFYAVLCPGGSLILQMLNHSAIGEGDMLPVRVTRKGYLIYQRFAERRGSNLYLYVTRLDLNTKPPALEIFRHEQAHFSSAEMTASLRLAGFNNIRRFANLFFSEKFERSSRDLVMTARRPRR